MYLANLQRDIVQLIEFLNESQNQASGRGSRGANAFLLRMKETLDGINLKPEKGRRKDLKKIEDVVRLMRKIALSARKDT